MPLRKSESAPCFVAIKNVLQENPDVILLLVHSVTLGVLDDAWFVHTHTTGVLKSVHNAEDFCPQKYGPRLWMETAG